jgi:hypothetical protein
MRYVDNDVEIFGPRGRRGGHRGRGQQLRQPPHGPGADPRGFGGGDGPGREFREGRPGWGAGPGDNEGRGRGRGGRGGAGGPGLGGLGEAGPRGPRGGGRGRGRAQRGDVRTAILLVVADEAMHGYQIMQAMNERTGGAWRVSPGAIYPTISQLAW